MMEDVHKDATSEELMVQADTLISKLSHMPAKTSLGDSQADSQAAGFPDIQARSPAKVAATLHRVVLSLQGLIDHGMFTEAQLAQARKWYVDTTAVVLGRFEFDETDHEAGSELFDKLQGKVDDAKHQMDRMNAAVQLHKMHDEKLMNTRDLGLIEQLRKTE